MNLKDLFRKNVSEIGEKVDSSPFGRDITEANFVG